MDNTTPILIISTGRTGTVFFAKLFGDVYPQVAAYHERRGSRPIQWLTNLYFAGLLPKDVLVNTWRLFKGNEIKDCDQGYHLDANSFLYGFVPISPESYPGLKVVHVVRDPRTYVASHLNSSRPSHRRRSFIANHFIPFWQPNPFFAGEIPWKRFFSMSKFERFCWIWDFKNRTMSLLEDTNIPYLRVRFEDIFHSNTPEKVFNKITDFIGLPRVDVGDRFAKPENKAQRDEFPDWHNWTYRQCAVLQDLCGNGMKQFGYGGEPDWLEKINPKTEATI